MRSFVHQCCWVLAVVMMAAGISVVQALTLGELSTVFPKHKMVEDRALVFAHDGVRYVALANGKKEVGIILLLPVRLSNYQKLEDFAEQFRKLIPGGAENFRVESFNYKGKTSQALINGPLLENDRPLRNRWMGVPLFHSLAYGIGKAKGRIAAVSEDSITLDVPNDLYGRMRVTIYLLSLGEVQIVDVVPKKRSKKSYENAEGLSREFDFYYQYEVDEDDVKEIRRDYQISRPLVYGRFYMGAHYTTLPSYVSVEGSAFRIGTARAFRELRARKDLDPLAYSGDESPMPDVWPVSSVPQSGGTAQSSSSQSGSSGSVPGGSSGMGPGRTALGSTQNPAQTPQPSAASRSGGKSPSSASGNKVIFYNPATALEAYKEALRRL